MMEISVVVPVYNVQEYLERCVLSILESRGNDKNDSVELILVDDGSTDSSGSICDRLQSTYDNVVTIHKENGGLASARNAGIEKANGEYVLFVDSDDWIDKDTICKLLECIREYSPDIIKFGLRRVVNRNTEYEEYPWVEPRAYYSKEIKNNFYYEALGNGRLFDYSRNFINSSCTSVYKKKIIIDNGIFFESEREILNEDILFNLKILYFANCIVVMNRCFYNYDCRIGSLTQRYKKDMYKRKSAFISNYEKFAKMHNINKNDKYKSRFNQFVIQQMYDCAVAECLWNKEKHNMFINLREVLNDELLKVTLQDLKGLRLSIKARAIVQVMRLKNPYLFYYLYSLTNSHRK